ncbi:MAG: hypothetical protein H8E85_01650 [Candidatus Marinimicrobia bacterium]|nr:hypothetical protein [Candidatus Neomarinimicrobiota bacterium]
MKRILLISLISLFVLPFTGWWILWIVLFLCGWFANSYREALKIGIAVAFLTWGIKIGIGFIPGGSLLMQRVADMMGLGSSAGLIIATLILGVFLGGLSAVSGYQLRKVF